MLKKLRKTILVIAPLIILSQNIAMAGVRSKLVEVGSEDRQALEECIVGLEECVKEKERVEAQSHDLSLRIDKLVADLNGVQKKNQDLETKVSTLTSENTTLASRIEELKKTLAETTATKTAKKKSSSDDTCVICKVPKVIGTTVAAPTGAVFGTLRGATNKGIQYANKGGDMLGESLPGQLVGKVGGGLVGIVTGAVTGLVRGIWNGIRYGFREPMSARSFSLAGKFATDYDPYKISVK